MSLVFAHKDPEFWHVIIEAAQDAGFEYVNTAVQSSKTPSLHKRLNPLTVLSGELVLNFRKVRSPRSIAISRVGSDAVQIIKDVSESVIVQNNGATTEQIYNNLIPTLLRHGLLGEVKKQMNDITPLLSQEFEFSNTDNLWHVQPNKKLGSFIKLEDRIRFYLTDYLTARQTEGKAASIDDIIKAVMPNLVNGHTPQKQTILSVLESIAQSPDGLHYELGQPDTEQFTLGLESSSKGDKEKLKFGSVNKDIEHNAVIFALAKLALAAGLQPYIGKKEQSGFSNSVPLSEVSLPKPPNSKGMTVWQRNKIQQIDLIWYDKAGIPLLAFEVETSTTIVSGIDRFMELLTIYPSLARSIVLVIPPKRLSKLSKILKDSHYIGHPLYMETKLTYCLTTAIKELYETHVSKEDTASELIQAIRNILVMPSQG